MRWLFLTFSLFVLGQSGCSQDLFFSSPPDTVIGFLTSPEDAELHVSWDVTNGSETPITLQVTRQLLSIVNPFNIPWQSNEPGAYERFCWGPICYLYGTQSSGGGNLLVNIAPGETNTTFYADYYHNGISGATVIQYCFHPPGNFSDSDCHTITFQVFDSPPSIVGCTYSNASNFSESADSDDGSCLFEGCTDQTAINYSDVYNFDDGSCYYVTPSNCYFNPDSNFDGLVNSLDLLAFLSTFGMAIDNSNCN